MSKNKSLKWQDFLKLCTKKGGEYLWKAIYVSREGEKVIEISGGVSEEVIEQVKSAETFLEFILNGIKNEAEKRLGSFNVFNLIFISYDANYLMANQYVAEK